MLREATQAEVTGTVQTGYLTIKYDELVAVMGEPHRTCTTAGEKVDVEWRWTWDAGHPAEDMTFTVYNYKTGPNYTGRPLADVDVFHVGGRFDAVTMFFPKLANKAHHV